jgi:hypothetical protein
VSIVIVSFHLHVLRSNELKPPQTSHGQKAAVLEDSSDANDYDLLPSKVNLAVEDNDYDVLPQKNSQ